MKSEILRMERVTTLEGETTLLDDFNLHIFRGEIMGLVCINDNGKESLIRLICRNTPIHYGRVYFGEALVNTYQHSPMTLNRVAVVEQKSWLVDDLTVADNVFVLRRGFRKYLIRPRVLNDQLRRLTEEIGISLDGGELVKDLSPYEKSVVELLRAVISGARLIVVRDISNSVSAADLSDFFDLLRHFCEKGFSFLYICNHHEEAFKICDRIAMMRDGKILRVLERKDFRTGNLQPYYIGAFTDFDRERVPRRGDSVLLRFEDVCTANLKQMSFSIAEGECTLLLDMDNTVLSDIMALMNGGLRQDSGGIFLGDAPYTFREAQHAVKNGVAFIAENPVRSMLFGQMSYAENLCFLAAEKRGTLHLRRRVVKSVIREYEPVIGGEVRETNIMRLRLSSLYSLVYYRVYLANPRIVFCVQPFAGADLYQRRHVIQLINLLKKKGITVVILAVNFADSLMVADRLLLLQDGALRCEYPSSEFYQFRSEGITVERTEKGGPGD